MSFTRSMCALSALSVLAGAAFFYAGMPRARSANRASYAALVVSETVPDREIRALFGDALISESSQWVLLDEFGSLARIPLDEYKSRVLPFDPRNDGYADKLRAFFVRGGKRFCFIPLGAGFSGSLDKRAAALLGEIPFSLEYLGGGTPVAAFLTIFGAAAALLFVLRFLPLRPRVETADLAFCLPVLAVFAFYGAAGFVLAALLAVPAVLLREPLREFFASTRGGGAFSRGSAAKERLWRDLFVPFRLNWLLAGLFLAAFTGLFVLNEIPPALSLSVFCAFILIFGFSVWVFSLPRGSSKHRRFVPLAIVKHPLSPVFAFVMLPFALAALAAEIAGASLPSARAESGLASLEGILTEDDYRAHAAFQASFSFKPLGSASGGNYRSFAQTDEGLVEPAETVTVPLPDFPPFPLKDLTNFLSILRAARRNSPPVPTDNY